MKSSVVSIIPESHALQKYTNFKTLNPTQFYSDKTSVQYSPQSFCNADAMLDLDSCSENQLKELKDQFVSHVERIRSFVKHIEARKSGLDQTEDVEKNSKILGQKRGMQVTPERETKRSKTIELNSTKARKVEAIMMRKCGVILDKLMKHKHGWVFNKPVDVVALSLPDYYQVVKCPMDLGTIKLKLDKGVYGTPLDFAKDVRLTFDNAMLYNMEGDEVHVMATVLLDIFDTSFDLAYEKYEVECQRLIVEQKKSSKPLAELAQEDGQEALCDAAPVVKTLDRENCKEAAKKSVLKKPRTVREVKENPRMRREMSEEERGQLRLALQDLVGEYLDEIMQIVAKRNSKLMTADGDGEIELDINALDNETVWNLHRFVRLNLKAKQNDKSPVAIEGNIDIGGEMQNIDFLPVVTKRDDSSSFIGKVGSS